MMYSLVRAPYGKPKAPFSDPWPTVQLAGTKTWFSTVTFISNINMAVGKCPNNDKMTNDKEHVKGWSRIRPPLRISLLQLYITSQL